jgi:hypothetical protein
MLGIHGSYSIWFLLLYEIINRIFHQRKFEWLNICFKFLPTVQSMGNKTQYGIIARVREKLLLSNLKILNWKLMENELYCCLEINLWNRNCRSVTYGLSKENAQKKAIQSRKSPAMKSVTKWLQAYEIPRKEGQEKHTQAAEIKEMRRKTGKDQIEEDFNNFFEYMLDWKSKVLLFQ